MKQRERTEIQRRIDALPAGGITYKTIKGRKYPYYQWREGGKQRSRIVKGGELELLSTQIAERRRLEELLRKDGLVDRDTAARNDLRLLSRTGEQLVRFARPVARWRRRACYELLQNYIDAEDDKVMILYGLRRTGKTTLVRQLICSMDDAQRSRAAFLQARAGSTLADANADLRTLERAGYRYVFIDEVTLLDDFIEGAALFSDVFAASGMRIVLSGADSLGFVFAGDGQLYDRCVLLRTTFIPYREFEGVLGIVGVDKYIRYGGTMSVDGANYNERGTFADATSAREYVNSAIAHNIQHSLKNYQYGGHFRHLRELYDAGELTSAINRVVEDMNHEFTIEVLTRDFKSHDLGVSAANLRRDRTEPTDVLDRVDVAGVTVRLKDILDILDSRERLVSIGEEARWEIQEYLALLDLTATVDVVGMPGSASGSLTVIAQPGLRYAQADALVESLMEDETFASVPLAERMRVTERIRQEIMGRMMEEIILLETKLARSGCRVFKLQFEVGEVDMVVFDPRAASCELFEIKHSARRDPLQRRHLLDVDKTARIETRYGSIAGRYVIYRGEPAEEDGVTYLNAERYLCGLGSAVG